MSSNLGSVPLEPFESTGQETARRERREEEDEDDAAWQRAEVEVEEQECREHLAEDVPPVAVPELEAGADRVREAVPAKGARDPGQPSKAEREAHNLTHCLYRCWCERCVRGQAVGRPHRRIAGEESLSTLPRVILDYAFLQQDMTKEKAADDGEEGQEDEEARRASMKSLVMVETECDSVWAYAVESKGTLMESWLVPNICEDMATVGIGKGRVVIKTDQEPAILDLQNEIAKARAEAGTTLDLSRVGVSDSNGKIERAIRRASSAPSDQASRRR